MKLANMIKKIENLYIYGYLRTFSAGLNGNVADKEFILSLVKSCKSFRSRPSSAFIHPRKTPSMFSIVKLLSRNLLAGDEPSEYLRKRRLVSTIETSPSRSLLEHSTVTSISGHSSYVGYCTIRNGMPLHEFSNLSTKHKSVSFLADTMTDASRKYLVDIC